MLTYAIACAGMTQIIVYGSIFNKIRPHQGWFGKLFHCPMCMGFWVGIFLWAISAFTELFTFDHSVVTAFVLGCYSSIVSYTWCMLIGDDGIQLRHNYREEDL